MSTNARASYKLPTANRHIVAFDNYNYFGGYLAKRDMTPIGFDRACPVPPYEPRHPMVMPGCGAVIERPLTDVQDPFTYAGVQAMSGLDLSNPVFESAEGTTSGQRFVIVGTSIYQVTSLGEMVQRYTIHGRDGDRAYGRAPHIVLAAIIAETTDAFIVQYISNEGLFSAYGYLAYSRRFMLVYKDGRTPVPLSGYVTGQIGSPDSSASANESGAHLSVGLSVNKFMRKLTKLQDGRLVYVYAGLNNYGTHSNSTVNFDYSQCQPRIVVVDPAAGRADGTRLIKYRTNVQRCVNGVPSPLVDRLPEGVSGLGSWYYPEVETPLGANYVIRMFVLPTLPSATSTLNSTVVDGNAYVCSISGAPEEFSLLAPAPNASTSRAQISTWTVKEGNDEYLVTFGHGNGRAHEETETAAPSSLSQLCVFKIGENPSELEYSHHMNDAASFGVILTDFVTSPDFKTVVVMNSSGFGILTWHPALRRYTASQWRPVSGGLYRLHLDTLDQIWVENMEGVVSVYNIALSSSVSVQFVDAPSSIIYSGETIEQRALIDAFTFTGNRIARQVRLTVKGCTFDDGSTVRTIETSDSESTEVTLYVNGSGNVRVEAALV